MYIDSQEIFSTAQTVTAIGDTASTNIYDTGSSKDIGIGKVPYIDVRVNTAVTSGGSATVAAVLQTSADGTTWTDALVGPALAPAAMTAGASLLKSPLPSNLKRYLRVAYRTATAVLTAGKFDAFIALDEQSQQYGTSGFTV